MPERPTLRRYLDQAVARFVALASLHTARTTPPVSVSCEAHATNQPEDWSNTIRPSSKSTVALLPMRKNSLALVVATGVWLVPDLAYTAIPPLTNSKT